MPHRQDNTAPRWQRVRYPPSKYGPTRHLYDPTQFGMGSTTWVSTQKPSRPAENLDPDAWGHGPQPHEATRQTMTQGSYLLRRPWKPGDDDKDHDGLRVA
jgi:hypothetical protein